MRRPQPRGPFLYSLRSRNPLIWGLSSSPHHITWPHSLGEAPWRSRIRGVKRSAMPACAVNPSSLVQGIANARL